MPSSRIKLKRYGVRINGALVRKSFASASEARKWQRAQKELQDQIRSGSKKYLAPTLLLGHAADFLRSRRAMASFGHQETRMGKYILARPESQGKLLHECDRVFWKKIFGPEGELVVKHGLDVSTHNQIRAMVHKMYEDARREFEPPRAAENPIHDIPPLPKLKKKIQILADRDAIAAYIRAAYALTLHPGWGIFTAIKLNTGLRQQNIIPLRWKDWINDGSTLWIREKYVRTKTFQGFKPGTKSDEDERLVGVNAALRKALEDWLRVTPSPGMDDFIAVNSGRTHLSQKQIWEANRQTLEAAGIPYLSEHKLRHSYATHYLAAGGSIHDLKQNLFHAAVTTTEIYAHALESELGKRAAVFQVAIPEPKKDGEK